MNFFSLNYRDQLSLRNAALYIENQNNLENLVPQCPLRISSSTQSN